MICAMKKTKTFADFLKLKRISPYQFALQNNLPHVTVWRAATGRPMSRKYAHAIYEATGGKIDLLSLMDPKSEDTE